jgi:hypothetical protein
VRIRFLTSTPLDIRRGSGTYVGIHVLARALPAWAIKVEFETPRVDLPVYTLQRLLFNRGLRAETPVRPHRGFRYGWLRIAARRTTWRRSRA